MIDWKLRISSHFPSQKQKDGEITICEFPGSLSLDFHKKMPKGAALRELEKQQFHLSNWETPYYSEAIRGFLKDVDKSSIILDAGCGDGRFTKLLIELGFSKIVATDIDIKPLKSLEQYLRERNCLDKVLLVNCGLDRIPCDDDTFDAVLAIGVLYYLNENFENGLAEVSRVLKKGGMLVNSEPDLEGAIYKSVFFERLDDVLENYFKRVFKEEKGTTPFKFKLFTENEIRGHLLKHGFSVKDKYGLSLFPSIVRILLVREELKREEIVEKEKEIIEVMKFLNGDGKLNKHIIWKSIKE